MGLGKPANKCWGSGLRAQWWDYSCSGDYFITICTKDKTPWMGEIIECKFIPSESGVIASELWGKIPQQFPNVELGAFVIMPDHIHGILTIPKHTSQNNEKKNLDNYPLELENKNRANNLQGDIKDNLEYGKRIVATPNNLQEDIINTLQFGKRIVAAPNNLQEDIMNNLQFGKRIVATRFIASIEPPSTQNMTPPIQKGGFANTKSPMLNNNISRVIRWYKGACTYQIRKSNPKFQWQSRFHDHMIRNSREYHDIAEYIQNNPMKWGLKHPPIEK